ncbi:MAG: 4-hydroxy-tetrahydrodipicolinate synthase [Chthoniobacterales bacterium]|nr:4-hydroxy-tetrahydrodipicolinate synthase [Chthoniobacterales bacterium]
MFAGTYTALVTPFRNGRVDDEGLRKLIEAQIAGGVDGIVPVGTTGESPTLSHDEHRDVIKAAVEIVAGRIKVIGGTGSNSTDEAIALTRDAEKAGADGALMVAPYYNKPSPEGLYRHFRAIAETTKLPIVLYSIPGRCGIEIGVPVVARLAEDCANIVAIKEAGGTVERVSQLRQAVPETFEILSGDDSLTLPFISVGAVGVISVASNVAPAEVSALVRAARDGQMARAEQLHRQLYPLFKNLFVESNPSPAKYALSLMLGLSPELRLPLVEMSEDNRELVRATLADLGLLP